VLLVRLVEVEQGQARHDRQRDALCPAKRAVFLLNVFAPASLAAFMLLLVV
jgi:hypothetical protein